MYGLKSSGASFRAFLAQHIEEEMGFVSTTADPDVWRRPAVKADGEAYYEYLLCYVDDVLCVSHDPDFTMKQVQEKFELKGNKWDDVEVYLGARITNKVHEGTKLWTMSSHDYLKSAIKEVEEKLKTQGQELPKKVKCAMYQSYKPELDSTEELSSDEITYFQELIGILCWSIEIGRVDILTEVSMLSAYQASPRRGHLKALLQIFAYIKNKPKLSLYFDPREPNIDYAAFKTNAEEFKEYYRDAQEEDPPRMPQPRGRSVTTTAFVDSSHAANLVTRKSHSGFIIFVNKAPITWFSKRTSTVETSAFSSEFIALKTCMEEIMALRYKLKMFGVPLQGPTEVFCDNNSVVLNTTQVESKLNKKHNSLAYHATRWAVAASIIRIAWIDGKDNIADAMTKILSPPTKDYLFGNWTY